MRSMSGACVLIDAITRYRHVNALQDIDDRLICEVDIGQTVIFTGRLVQPLISASGKALRYLHNEWSKLTVYLQDGRLEIDNNLAEPAPLHGTPWFVNRLH